MEPLVIKLGGVLLDSEEALERLFTALQTYRQSHQRPLVIVHGGGCLVDELMQKLQLPVIKSRGYALRQQIRLTLLPGLWLELRIKPYWHGRLNTNCTQ